MALSMPFLPGYRWDPFQGMFIKLTDAEKRMQRNKKKRISSSTKKR